MSRTAAENLEDSRQLPPREVIWLIENLLIQDEVGSEEELDAAWDGEVKRRLDEIDSGTVQMVSLGDVLARMDARLQSRLAE